MRVFFILVVHLVLYVFGFFVFKMLFFFLNKMDLIVLLRNKSFFILLHVVPEIFTMRQMLNFMINNRLTSCLQTVYARFTSMAVLVSLFFLCCIVVYDVITWLRRYRAFYFLTCMPVTISNCANNQDRLSNARSVWNRISYRMKLLLSILEEKKWAIYVKWSFSAINSLWDINILLSPRWKTFKKKKVLSYL